MPIAVYIHTGGTSRKGFLHSLCKAVAPPSFCALDVIAERRKRLSFLPAAYREIPASPFFKSPT